ncbi:MAG: HAMP domain-containing sensor histidine kinase [bacterium]|nr:HAMP domain-containing sensor histidine kinase [bacterium]
MKPKKKLRNFLKSLQCRLMIAFTIIGLLPGIALRVGLIHAYENQAVSNRSIDILNQARILSDQIVNARYLEEPANDSINSRLENICNIYDGRILVVDNTFHILKDTYDLDTSKIIISEEVATSFQGKESSKYDSVNRYIQLTLPLRDTNTQEVLGVLLVSVSTDSVRDLVSHLKDISLFIQLISAIIVVGIAVLLANVYSNPLRKMSKHIEEIQTGYGEDVLMIDDYTETEQISDKINALLKNMRVLDESRQEFVSNVSHELKTPLTSMKVLADSLIAQEGAPVALYQEFMSDIASEIDRENQIISDLLSLVKMDKAADSLNIASVNVNESLELIMKRLMPIAEKQGVELVLESFRPVTAEIDETKMSLAMTNLIENAIKYNEKPDGWVHVSLNADHQYFYVKVEDNGIGIPEESLDHIYERFYRVDKSHSREIGGTGLGLAITRNVILMHRGAIKAFSTEGEGTIFTVRIPLNYIVS